MTIKKTILCVDDDHSLSIHKVTLETRGYRVMTCNSALAAMSVLDNAAVDLVLSSLELPDANIAELVWRVKSTAPTTPVVLLCPPRRALYTEPDADLMLRKGSYAPAELLDSIRILLGRRRGPRRTGTLTPAVKAC